MPSYSYYCEYCDVDIIQKSAMLDPHPDFIVCPLCGGEAWRVYGAWVKPMNTNGYAGARTNATTPRYAPMKQDKKEVHIDGHK